MEHRPSPQAVERALKLLEGSVLAVEVKHLQRELVHYERMLGPLCPCAPHDPNTDGPQRECPVHGDGQTFTQWVDEMRDELAMRRARVTTGGPAPAFTGQPEEIVVAVPASEEERAEMQPVHPHGNPYNCPCPNEAPAVDHVEKPPSR